MPSQKARKRQPPRVRIAVIGGGCAGMTVAWELAQRNLDPDAAEHYEVTVFEADTRLGGKGASWRDEQGRIREHGLHIWLGFYENAFGLIRQAYAEAQALGMGPQAHGVEARLPFASFEQAFTPESHVGVASRRANGSFATWTGHLPPMKGLPGDPIDADSNPFTLAAYLARCLGLSRALIHSLVAGPDGSVDDAPAAAGGSPRSRPNQRSASDEQQDLDFARDGAVSIDALVARMSRWLEVGLLTSAAGMLQGAAIVETWLRQFNPMPQFDFKVLRFLEALATQTRKRLRKVVDTDLELRRKTEVIDLIMTIVVGLYRDRVLFDQERGLDAIDHIDCRDWLVKHGALKTSANSPFVTGLYDLAFCYEGGNRAKPALAAGQALRGALRMFFTYRGAIFWRMNAGMGETIFSPLYQVLRSPKRWHAGQEVSNPCPVDFRFGHTLQSIQFEDSSAGCVVSALTFTKPKGRRSRKPVLDHLGCWPGPALNPPPEGAQVTQRWARAASLDKPADNTFHGVVFALGIDALQKVTAFDPLGHPLPDAIRIRWQAMFSSVRTITTQAAQVWLKQDMEELGWARGPVLVSGCKSPLETWADMSHTLPSEMAWRQAAAPPIKEPDHGSVVYFCGVIPDAEVDAKKGQQAALDQLVRTNLNKVLGTQMGDYWPRCEPDEHGKPRIDLLSQAAEGLAHVQANAIGSARYTLALPGSAQHRISPLDRSVVNLTLAGDWTDCGFNEGCVEAAVMSGRLAAHAISGHPALHDIIGYDHP